MSKGAQIAIAVVTVFGGLAWLLSSGGLGGGTFQYYESVSAFLARTSDEAPESSRGTRVRGLVVKGSILKDLSQGHIDFIIEDRPGGPGRLRVRLLGIDIPDLFKEGAEVVVEGRLEEELFLADRVLAKCPSKYEVVPGTDA